MILKANEVPQHALAFTKLIKDIEEIAKDHFVDEPMDCWQPQITCNEFTMFLSYLPGDLYETENGDLHVFYKPLNGSVEAIIECLSSYDIILSNENKTHIFVQKSNNPTLARRVNKLIKFMKNLK